MKSLLKFLIFGNTETRRKLLRKIVRNRRQLRKTICKWYGHKIESDANVGPDSGSETLYCRRCGDSWHHIYY